MSSFKASSTYSKSTGRTRGASRCRVASALVKCCSAAVLVASSTCFTLRYLRDPKLQRNVHRSQNRIESYHQLRSAIAQVGGKKELTGRTDIEIEINNQCARLIANAIIYYNSAILSRLLTKYAESPGLKALAMIK